jgi:hypothetical protein
MFPWLGLARGFALSGDPAKARTHYQDFFTKWKDADPDIPILNEAKGGVRKAGVTRDSMMDAERCCE